MSELSNDTVRSRLHPGLSVFDLGECQAYVDWLAILWNQRNVENILPVFTDDAEVEYSELTPIKGLAEIQSFLKARFAQLSVYHLKKTARLARKPLICVELDVRWSSVREPTILKRTRAFEILTIKDSKIAKWELVATPHPRKLL